MKNASANIHDVSYELFGLRLSNIELWKRIGQLKDRAEAACMKLNAVAKALEPFQLEGEDTLKAIRRIVGEYKELRHAVEIARGASDRVVRVYDVHENQAVVVCSNATYEDVSDKADKYDRLIDRCSARVQAAIRDRSTKRKQAKSHGSSRLPVTVVSAS